jgi:hypothetical protein
MPSTNNHDNNNNNHHTTTTTTTESTTMQEEDMERRQKKRQRRESAREEAKRLRPVRRAFAEQVAEEAEAVLRGLKALMRTHERLGGAAARAVGRDYETRHIVSFEEAALAGGSMAAQKELTGEAHTPSLEDMLRAVQYIKENASAVAARPVWRRPKRLPLESPLSSSSASSSSSAEEEEEVEEGELVVESEEEEELEEGEIIMEEVPSAVVVWQC